MVKIRPMIASLVLGILAAEWAPALADDPAGSRPGGQSCSQCGFFEDISPRLAQNYIGAIQQALREKGYEPGPIDGRRGPKTRQAIVAYQREAGLQVDGEVSTALLDHLNFARQNSRSKSADYQTSQTRWLQAALASGGFSPGPLDGIAGERTKRAVAAFQEELSLPATGRADETTVRALQEHLASDALEPLSPEVGLFWQEPSGGGSRDRGES